MKRLLSISIAIALALTGWSQTQTFNLENPAVRAYMADRTYDTNSDYSVTVIEKYNTDSYFADRDRPMAVTLRWDKPEGASSVKIIVSEDADFKRVLKEETQSATKRSYVLYNLIPGRTYYYKVQTQASDGEQYVDYVNSSFETLGQVRMIRIDGMTNVRDLGGWMTSFGRPINYGLVYRNARTDEVTLAGINAYKELGMAAELDLRDDSELTKSPLGEDIDYVRLASTAQYSTGIKNDWQPFVNDFNWIVARLREGKVLNFHCTAGADRTGTLAWLLEGLLGVGEADLSRDFELTTFDGTWGARPRPYDPGKGNLGDMLAYIRTFGNANDLTGCFYNYWINRGAKAEDIAFFRHLMIDEYVPAEAILCSDATLSLSAGDSYQITASVSPANATYTNVRYSSSDKSVVVVDEYGVVTAVGDGNAYIEVKSIKGEASTVIRVHVAGSVETNGPAEVVVPSGDKLKVYATDGDNIIANGSFEYSNAYFGWYSGASDMLNSANFEVVKTEAPDGGSYLRALKGDVSGSAASIVNTWRIQQNKTYVFGYKVRNEKGAAMTGDNLKVSLIALDSEAEGNGSDLGWGDGDIDDAPEAKQMIKVVDNDNVFAAPAVSGEWTDVQYVFNSTDNLYMKVDFSQLAGADWQLAFDGFYLLEAKSSKEVEVATYIDNVSSGVVLANYGNEAFQHPQHLAEAVEKTMQAMAESRTAGAAKAADAINAFHLAWLNYQLAGLNKPAVDEKFNVKHQGMVAYYDGEAVDFISLTANQRPLALQFVATGERDAYTMSFATAKDNMFIDFVAGVMTATVNAADAKVVVVEATETDGLYNLRSESGDVLLAGINITKALADKVSGDADNMGWGDDDEDDQENLTGVSGIMTDADAELWSLDGQRLNSNHKGVSILRTRDGRVRKVVIN